MTKQRKGQMGESSESREERRGEKEVGGREEMGIGKRGNEARREGREERGRG